MLQSIETRLQRCTVQESCDRYGAVDMLHLYTCICACVAVCMSQLTRLLPLCCRSAGRFALLWPAATGRPGRHRASAQAAGRPGPRHQQRCSLQATATHTFCIWARQCTRLSGANAPGHALGRGPAAAAQLLGSGAVACCLARQLAWAVRCSNRALPIRGQAHSRCRAARVAAVWFARWWRLGSWQSGGSSNAARQPHKPGAAATAAAGPALGWRLRRSS